MTRGARERRSAGSGRTLLVLLLATLVSCDLFGPAKGLDGGWEGRWPVGDDAWIVVLDLTMDGDSMHGTASVDAVGYEFGLEYFVQGARTDDSVHIRLRPVEDADINFAGVFQLGELTGEAWFNSNVGSANPLTFTRR